jgi:hypothetical protein
MTNPRASTRDDVGARNLLRSDRPDCASISGQHEHSDCDCGGREQTTLA